MTKSAHSCLSRLALLILLLCLASTVLAQSNPIVFRVETFHGTDTLFAGHEALIFFTADTDGQEVLGFGWPLIYHFSNGNIMGDLTDPGHVYYPAAIVAAFETRIWNVHFSSAVTDPDTTQCTVVDGFADGGWIGAGPVWGLRFVPTDTGLISIDSVRLPLASVSLEAVSTTGQGLPVDWQPAQLVVIECPVPLTGDANGDGVVTSGDIIQLLICVFKDCFPGPEHCDATLDVNCNGLVTSADIIYLVNYIFKGGPEPCDVCELILDGTWSCP